MCSPIDSCLNLNSKVESCLFVKSTPTPSKSPKSGITHCRKIQLYYCAVCTDKYTNLDDFESSNVDADTAPFLLVARTPTVWTTRTPKGRQPWDVTRVSIWCRRRASGPAPRTAVDMDSGKFLPSFSFWQILTFCRFLDSKFDILLCS